MRRQVAYTPGSKPTGSISTWVRQRDAVTKEGADAYVPCGECAACCACGYDIEADQEPLAGRFLAKKEDGSCAHLLEGKCSIYKDRPRACRTFDCREFLFSGIVPERELLIGAVYQWDPMSCIKTREDREILVAMKMAGEAIFEKEGDAETKSALVVENYRSFLPQARIAIKWFRDHPSEQKQIAEAYNDILYTMAKQQKSHNP